MNIVPMTPGFGRQAVPVPIVELRREFDAVTAVGPRDETAFKTALDRAERRAYWVGVALRVLYAVLPQKLFTRVLWKICRIRVWA